jgi:hypothetical protein
MQVHKKPDVRLSELDELFPSHPQPLIPKKAADVLQSRVIHSFETAVDQGMQPLEALSAILSWVSLEMGRIQVGRSNTPRGKP